MNFARTTSSRAVRAALQSAPSSISSSAPSSFSSSTSRLVARGTRQNLQNQFLPSRFTSLRGGCLNPTLASYYSTSSRLCNANNTSAGSGTTGVPTAPSSEGEAAEEDTAPEEPRFALTFTCTAEVADAAAAEGSTKQCGGRSTHTFTKRAYQKGIVIIKCPTCENRHLIADNLGWFKDSTEEGKLRNVEDFMKARGEAVRTGRGFIGKNGEPIEFA